MLTSDLHTCSCGHTLMHRSPTQKYSDTHEWIPKSNIYFPILLVVSIAQTDFCDPPASESQHSLGIWKATWTTVGAEEGTRLARKGERVVIISWVCLSWDLPSSFRGEHISPASWLQKLWLPGTACIKDSLKNRCSIFFRTVPQSFAPFSFWSTFLF